MKPEDTIRLARKSGFGFNGASSPAIQRFADLVAVAEREACKQALLEIADQNVGHADEFAKNIYFCVSVISDRGQA